MPTEYNLDRRAMYSDSNRKGNDNSEDNSNDTSNGNTAAHPHTVEHSNCLPRHCDGYRVTESDPASKRHRDDYR